MADAVTNVVMFNGFKNVVIRFSDLSDGTGLTNYVLVDPTSSGTLGVKRGGQTFYPGVHLKIMRIDYDVQDMKVRMQWDAGTPQDVEIFGNAPEDFDYTALGGLIVPPGLAGATGKILLSTVSAVPNASCNLVLRLTKGVPQS